MDRGARPASALAQRGSAERARAQESREIGALRVSDCQLQGLHVEMYGKNDALIGVADLDTFEFDDELEREVERGAHTARWLNPRARWRRWSSTWPTRPL